MTAKKGNQTGVLHGGEGAIKRLHSGEPFIGIARDAELQVINDLEEKGRPALVVQNATRLQAACDLFWNAVSKAAQDGNIDAIDKYIARFGWLAGVSLRAWLQVAGDEKDTRRGASVIDVLQSLKGGDDVKGE